MKKILSCTLATAVATSPVSVFATNNAELPQAEDKIVEKVSANTVTGKLELDINFPMPIIDSENMDIKAKLNLDGKSLGEVSLRGNGGTLAEGALTYKIEKLNSKREALGSNEKEIYFIRVVFENLTRGNYSVELSGNGYSTAFIENIDISNYSKRIKVGTSENVINTKDAQGNEKQEVYKGAFLAGNVNSEVVIDMKDYDLVLQETFNSTNNPNYDINKDQKVDLSDLTNIKNNLGKSNVVLNSSDYENTDAIIDPETIEIQVPENITVTGNIKDILTANESTIAIGNTDIPPTPENPISFTVDLGSKQSSRSARFRSNEGRVITSNTSAVEMETIVIKSPTVSTSENSSAPQSGIIKYIDANGNAGEVRFDESTKRNTSTKNGSSTQDIVIDLGKQVAVKEITIDVTANRGNKNISEIAQIEFLNNVYKEIPKPKMNIPQIRTVETSTDLHDERITLSWEPQPNVTGYEVKYQKLDERNNVQWTKTLQTNKTELNILDKAIKPYDLFRVSIQSLNGDWKSGYANELDSEDKGYWTGSSPLDGKADNVDENYNPVSGYYGQNNAPSDKGTISEIRVIPQGKPSKPINLSITPGYKSFGVSWENHNRARDFDIYYKKADDESKIWKKANDNNIEVEENSEAMTNPDKSKLSRSHSYTVNGLEDNATYEVRVTATNHFGTSEMSEGYLAKTDTLVPPVLSNYRLINTPVENPVEGESPVNAVKDIKYPQYSKGDHPNGVDRFAVVDNDYSTYWTSQGGDARYDAGGVGGPIIEFETEQSLGGLTFISRLDGDYKKAGMYGEPFIRYEDENGKMVDFKNISYTSLGGNQKGAYKVTFNEEIKTKKIQVSHKIATHGVAQKANIAEIKVYGYDSLEKEVSDLFTDNLRLELKDTVTQGDIDRLVKQAKTMDPVSKEYHPNLRNILGKNNDQDPKYRELGDNTYLGIAQRLLEEASISKKVTTLDTVISDGGSANIGMGNDWQSLGSVARPGVDEDGQAKEITVYMGSNNPNAEIEIVFLQSYGQPGKYQSSRTTVKPGRTTISIPEIFDVDAEKGGVVMARIKRGVRPSDEVKVRLSGVTDIPHLNVNNIINDTTKEAEIKDMVRTYIKDLKKYVGDLPNMYPKTVSPSDKLNNVYTYDPKTSALDSTDIEGDRFTLTFPASQILTGIEESLKGNEDAQVDRLYNALLAWEQEMKFAYSKKGVYEEIKDFNGSGEIDQADKDEFNKNKAPRSRMNIKYQRMIMGAAGYASSHHVGVTNGSNLVQGVPYKFDENGKVTNPEEGKLYGDLIGHEIGHVMDVNGRIYDETSNNLMTNLMRTIDDVSPSTIEGSYDKLYQKVTSNTQGLSTDRTLVLGMLWQLRLAYEDNYTSEMIFNDNDTNPDNDSYFAKINRAYRNRLTGEYSADKNQTLIRISSRVAERDLTDFFISHGIVPDAGTYNYVSKWPKEERKIQYINDEARRKRLSGISSMAQDTQVVASFGVDKEGNEIKNGSYVNQKEVPLNLGVSKDSDKILGYEILRNGKPWGFVQADGTSTMKYDDVIDNVNNRTFEYSIVAYDYLLNKTEPVKLGTVKVRHDGSISKKSLNLKTNTIDKTKNNDTHGDNESIKNMLDSNKETIYEGRMMTKDEYNSTPNKVEDLKPGNDPYVIIDTNTVNALAGIKYTAPTTTTKLFKTNKLSKSAIQRYEIQVSKDGNSWTKVKEGTFDINGNDPTTTVYFDKDAQGGGKQLATHNARFVKLIAKGTSEISIAELDVISPPGDNIEIGVAADNINYKNGLGILKEKYTYVADDPETAENEEKSIPAGSIIITGEYRGNPAFNVPLVLNQDEEHIANEYKGILLADIPNSGNLEEISEGNWIYWVTPEHSGSFMTDNKEIFAELYRTDSADAQDGGQRLVSNTFKIEVPNELPEISLSSKGKNSESQKAIELNPKTLNKLQQAR